MIGSFHRIARLGRAGSGMAAAVLTVAVLAAPAQHALAARVTDGEPPPPAESAPATSAGIPALRGPVMDEANILDAATEASLQRLSMDVKARTGAEIAVLTVKTTRPLDEFSYGLKVVETWKLGSAERDDGLLLLVAVEDRKTRFFSGYGLEGVLPDGRLGGVLDTAVVPGFRAGNYAAGITAGMREIARILLTEYDHGTVKKPVAQPASRRQGGWASLLPLLILFAIVAMTRRNRRRRSFFPIFWGGGFGGPMGGGWGGGFGGGGGGFGGFGGGGGGFGGGGAGRSW
ncbi:MAG TPA: TPM domain-containing protein [Candidatus Binatia bacterium]|nr:TPM domain-containing protein [Candidatus Binatia bacterium]